MFSLNLFRSGRNRAIKSKIVMFMTLVSFFSAEIGYCCTMDISDTPMLTRATPAPSLIMFVLDNSGSMDWEFMTSETNGLFNGDAYLYPDTAYINGQDRLSAWDILAAKTDWKSQWSGYNKIFYNHEFNYAPWPQKSNASTSEPWSNPNNTASSDPRFNMAGEYYTVAGTGTRDIVVDNVDSSCTFNTPAAWNENTSPSGYTPYGTTYHFTSTSNDAVNDWVEWKPNLPWPGTYEVFVWWTSNAQRAADAVYDIYHDGTTDNSVAFDQKINNGQWNVLGSYTFDAGGSEYVRLDPTTAGESKYSADAVKFSSVTFTISVTNAHYFAIDDTDGDGEHDTGEAIYLVNFVDTDGDGLLDDRDYYLFNDGDSDNRVETGELEYKEFALVPTDVKAGVYNESGTRIGDKSVQEDLQNWANWFSYYRKRELSAKAAVAASINDIDRAYVGFYTINNQSNSSNPGIIQPVLPIRVEVNDIIVDNKEPSKYKEVGTWQESSASDEFRGSSMFTYYSGSATWTPNLPTADTYEVYVWYTLKGDRDENALYTVQHKTGNYTVRLNQKVDYSQWVKLGDFNFDAGTSGYVSVTRDGSSTGTSTSADAVKFIGHNPTGTMVDDRSVLLNLLYNLDSSGSTPLRRALDNVGRYLHADDGGATGGIGTSPFATEADGGACQQAFTILITDGFWNGSDPGGVGNEDADDAGNEFDGSPFADAHSTTLADVAMKYYKNDLVSSLPDLVPATACERATMANPSSSMHQHMVTYGVSFGVTGTLDPASFSTCMTSTSNPLPTWPQPAPNQTTTIDDLWHSTVNGRGLFFSASDPDELVSSLVDLTSDISSRTNSGSSVSVNGEELNSGTVLYQARYQVGSWKGTVMAFPVLTTSCGTAEVDYNNPIWDASDELKNKNWNDRLIVTYNSDLAAGVEFADGNLTTAQEGKLGPASERSDFINYIKGKYYSTLRVRDRGFDPVSTAIPTSESPALGDIVHAAPIYIGDSIYAGSNDGMLHVFNAQTGEERFAYIPDLVFDNFYDETDPDKSFHKPGYAHKFFVDLTPSYREYVDIETDGTSNKFTYMVGGLGKGGKGVYCLDITNADTITSSSAVADVSSMVKWEFSDANDMGYSYSKPVIVKSNADSSEAGKKKWVVIFGNGYDSTNGDSILYILDLDGTVIKKIPTGQTGCNGLSSVAAVDVDYNLTVDYVYAGDLQGNMWKFDLTSSTTANWEVAFEDASAGQKVPLVKIPTKSITSTPDIMMHCADNTSPNSITCPGPEKVTGYMVYFGTGRFLGETDKTDLSQQYIMGIWDYGDDIDDSEYLGDFNSGANSFSNQPSGVKLLEQTLDYDDYLTITTGCTQTGTQTSRLRVLSNNSPTWHLQCDPNGLTQNPDPITDIGWVFALPDSGERIMQDVIVRDGRLIYLTFTPDSSPCAGGGTSIVHEVDACNGGRLDYAQLDINQDGVIDDDDLIDIVIGGKTVKVSPSAIGYDQVLHVPIFIRGPAGVETKTFADSVGGSVGLGEREEKRGLLYWRQR